MLIKKDIDFAETGTLDERLDKIRVVCVGDSITGADLRGPFTAYGSKEEDVDATVEVTDVTHLMQYVLGQRNEPPKENPEKKKYNVIIQEGPRKYYPFQLEGLLGEEVANLGFAMELSRVAPVLVEYGLQQFSHSEVYVVGFGTNDFGMFKESTNQEISDHILSNFQKTHELLVNNHKEMVLLGLLPICGKFEKDNSYLAESNEIRRAHNNQLNSFCLERNIHYVDLSDLKDEHFLDAIHPNYNGAEAIAKKVYKVTTHLLETG